MEYTNRRIHFYSCFHSRLCLKIKLAVLVEARDKTPSRLGLCGGAGRGGVAGLAGRRRWGRGATPLASARTAHPPQNVRPLLRMFAPNRLPIPF